MTLEDAFKTDCTIKFDLQAMTVHRLPISMMPESLSHLEVLTKASMTTKEKILTHLRSVKCPYDHLQFQDVAFFQSATA